MARSPKLVKEIQDLREALARARKLASLVTVGDVVRAGDRYINAAGLNPYVLNEGRASERDRLNLWWIDHLLPEG